MIQTETKSHFPIRFQDSVSIFTSTRAYTTWKFLPAAISCGKTRRPWARQCRLCRFSQLHASRGTDVSHCHHWSAQCRSSLTNLHTHTTWVHYYNSLFAFTFYVCLARTCVAHFSNHTQPQIGANGRAGHAQNVILWSRLSTFFLGMCCTRTQITLLVMKIASSSIDPTLRQ